MINTSFYGTGVNVGPTFGYEMNMSSFDIVFYEIWNLFPIISFFQIVEVEVKALAGRNHESDRLKVNTCFGFQ